jgi:hypothetical protein
MEKALPSVSGNRYILLRNAQDQDGNDRQSCLQEEVAHHDQ